MKKVSIIGAGIAGMSAAVHLLESGYDVTLYEKHIIPGGFLTGWDRRDMHIDGCIHWMCGTKKDTNLNKLWYKLGALNDDINIINLDSFYKVEYNSQELYIYNDYDKLEKELYKYSVNDDEKIRELMEAIRYVSVYEVPTEIPNRASMVAQLRFLSKVKRFINITLEDYAKEYNSEIIKFALTHGLVDKKFSVFYFIHTISNLCEGNAGIPQYGSKNIAMRMKERIESLGGVVKTNSNVSEILIENNKAVGIVCNNENIYSDYVVAACDIHHTYKVLLKDMYDFNLYNEMDNQKDKYPTYSLAIASYKVKVNNSSDVAVIKKVDNYKLMDREHDYICIRSYNYDDSLINDGYMTVQVFLNTYENDYDYLENLSKDEYKEFKKKFGTIYINRLKEHFNTQEVELIDTVTPLTYKRYVNSYKGTFMTYALGAGMRQNLGTNIVKEVEGLYIANQWLMAPGGTGIAAAQGKYCADIITGKIN